MVHLFRLKNKSFSAATIVKGKLVWELPPSQQYKRKQGVLTAIRSGMKSFNNTDGSLVFQDDSVTPSVICLLFEKGKPGILANRKPVKPYVPQSKKKVTRLPEL